MRRRAFLLAAVLVASGVGACVGETERPVRIAAAASLADVVPMLLREHPRRVETRFGASPTLARQIVDGAGSDAMISADPRWVDELVRAGLADAGSRRVIATNRLVAIVPAGATSAPRDVRELADLAHVAVAAPEVPAGAHARAALERSGVIEKAAPRLVLAADVRAALGWVAQGEAEGGIVYATDARAEPRVRVAFELDRSAHDPIVYEAVALTPAGREIVDLLASERARRVLAEAGFGPP